MQRFSRSGDIAEGAAFLAEGKDCRNQAFRVGHNAYGLQFHLEVTEDMIENWFSAGDEKTSLEKLLREAEKVRDQYRTQTGQVLSNFMRIIESSLRLRKLIKVFIDDPGGVKKKKSSLWWNPKKHTLTTAGDP